MELHNEVHEQNQNLTTVDLENLHHLMEDRLEKILQEVTKEKKQKKKSGFFPILPANKEKPEWNLSEIPILFGA